MEKIILRIKYAYNDDYFLALNHDKNLVFNHLVSDFKWRKGDTDATLFAEAEHREFQRLFVSGESGKDWSYLSHRLEIPELYVEQIYRNRISVITGEYKSLYVASSKDKVKHESYAVLLAARDYVTFLATPVSSIPIHSGFKSIPSAIDDRIQLSESCRNYVQDCFMELTLDINGMDTGKSLMKESDVHYFLQSNFKGFGQPLPRKTLSSSFKSKTHLSYFVGEILRPLIGFDECFITLDSICRLMRANFLEFQDQSKDSLQTALRNRVKTPIHLLNAIYDNKKSLK